MPDIEAQTPDGVTHSFPDGTPPEVVDSAIKKYVTEKSSSNRNAVPTQFEQQRDPSNQKGFISTVGDYVKNVATTPPDVSLQGGLESGIPGLGVANSIGKGFSGARARGHGLAYSAVAGLGAPLGVNAEAMERAADVGNSRAILGEAAVPTAMALSPLALDGARSISDFAKESPDVAAARALNVPKTKALKAEANVTTARPYFQGADSLKDLQGRIPAVKAEIWQPYKDAVNQVGDNRVQGPDGPSTVRELEEERLKTSAKLSAARNMKPGDLQTAIQKDEAIADLTKRDAAIKAAIDPELRKTGIDPQLIRNTFGGVRGVQSAVEGRSTLTDSRPSGFGKMADKFNLLKPGQSLQGLGSGARDVLAGRPLFSGSPTDIAVKEGFRIGGDKPNLTPFPPTIQQNPLRGLLGAGPLITPPSLGESYARGIPAEVSPLAENRQLPPAGSTAGPRTVLPKSQFGISVPEGGFKSPPYTGQRLLPAAPALPTEYTGPNSAIRGGLPSEPLEKVNRSAEPMTSVQRDPKTGQFRRIYLSEGQPLSKP